VPSFDNSCLAMAVHDGHLEAAILQVINDFVEVG
jgi:hypothetical protein